MNCQRSDFPTVNVGTFWKRNRVGLSFLMVCAILSFKYQTLILGAAFALFLVLETRRRSSVDWEMGCLIIAFLSFGTILMFHGTSLRWAIYYSFTPIFMYGLGKYYMGRWFSEDNLLLLIFFIGALLSIQHIIITIYDIYYFGIINPYRDLQILGDESESMAVTQRTIMLSLSTIGFSLLFYKPTNKFQKKIKTVFIVLAFFGLLCFVHYISRTGLVLSLISLFVGLFICPFGKNKMYYLFFFVLIMCGLIIIMRDTILGIFQLYSEREIEGSSFLDAGGRTAHWTLIFEGILTSPFGHKANTFAHNMWLDIGKSGGIIPFFFLVWFSLANIIKTIKIARNKHYTVLIRLLILVVTIIFLLSCFTECIHEGVPMYMFFYCMFCGMVNSVYKYKQFKQ